MSRSVISAILAAAYLSTPLVRGTRDETAKDFLDLDITDQVVKQNPAEPGTVVHQEPGGEPQDPAAEADAVGKDTTKKDKKPKKDNTPPGFFARMKKKVVGAVRKLAKGRCSLENNLFSKLDATNEGEQLLNEAIDEGELTGAEESVQTQLLDHIHATKFTPLDKAQKIAYLKRIFKALDVDADGYIDKEDFCHGVQRMQQFFFFDESEDEKLDIIEFNQGFALSEFFDGMDLDKSETLDVKELEMAKEDVQLKLQTITGVKGMRKVFKTLDTNGDGSVDKLEFVVSLRKALEARRAVRT
jgi:Ca2+-binding EF-hand superfamily protein